MNINLTLIVQMIVFIVLIWFTMKFVWPMILGPMGERARKKSSRRIDSPHGTYHVRRCGRFRQPLGLPQRNGVCVQGEGWGPLRRCRPHPLRSAWPCSPRGPSFVDSRFPHFGRRHSALPQRS